MTVPNAYSLLVNWKQDPSNLMRALGNNGNEGMKSPCLPVAVVLMWMPLLLLKAKSQALTEFSSMGSPANMSTTGKWESSDIVVSL
jgi:hypothetical protein